MTIDTTDQQAGTVAQEADEAHRLACVLRIAQAHTDEHGEDLIKAAGMLDRLVYLPAITRLASVSSASAEGRTLWEAGRMAERGAENVAHELNRDPKWKPSRADYGSLGTLLQNIASTSRIRSTPEPVPATNQAGEVDRLREALKAWSPEGDDRVRPLLLAEAGRRDAVECNLTDANHVIAFLLDRLDAAVVTHPSAAPEQGGQVFRSMDTWDDRDEIVMLLVDYREDGDHALDDADVAITVGHNNDHNVGEGEGQGWQFAGWCWTHDHYVEGKGKPVGWMPLPHILARAYAAFDDQPAPLATQPATSQEGEACSFCKGRAATTVADDSDVFPACPTCAVAWAADPGFALAATMTPPTATSQEGEGPDPQEYLDFADAMLGKLFYPSGASRDDVKPHQIAKLLAMSVKILANALADTPTPPTLSEELRTLQAAVANLLPIGNDSLPGDRVIPIYVRMDELRALHALARAEGKAS